jgi:5-methylcytosine-specific restriction protein A
MHSVRYLKEQRARMQLTRDPKVSAMYDSREWFILRAQVKRDADGRCQWPNCTASGVCVDHRNPHRGDRALFFSRANLWLLCKTHHDKKTARFDGGFGNARKTLADGVAIWPAAGPPRDYHKPR